MSVIFINPYRFGYTMTDVDAAAYVARVEGASGDSQPLESGVRQAIDQFVIGCKADGIWNAIKASCILAGARTLNGALQPLVGTAPTPFSFLPADYNRKTGLAGDGSTKYLNSNRNNNADPQNSKHISTYFSTLSTLGFAIVGTEEGAVSGSTQLAQGLTLAVRLNSSAGSSGTSAATGFVGANRNSSSSFILRRASENISFSVASEAGSNRSINIYRRPVSDFGTYTNARLAFYSIGESLDLALLDARVTTLINAFAAAIP